MGGKFNRIVSTKDTEGDLCIYNTVRQEKGGPALHLHHKQDEWFYVMKGEFVVKVGDDTFTLKPGDSAFHQELFRTPLPALVKENRKCLSSFSQPARWRIFSKRWENWAAACRKIRNA